MKLIIEIPNKIYNALTHTEFNANLVVDEMRKSIENGTPIPDNATNGEIIDLIFPYEKNIDAVWWNSPYQKGDKE